MKSCEENIAHSSDYYIYSPSKIAKDMLLYPLQMGEFHYLPGYHLVRESVDNLLLIYIRKGNLHLTYQESTHNAPANSFLFIDCNALHEYWTDDNCECIWCHFDGIVARPLYEQITSRLGNAFVIPDAFRIVTKLELMLDCFRDGRIVKEPLFSKYLNDILTSFMLFSPADTVGKSYADIAEESISFINENFAEDISIDELATRAGVSPFHYIRIFKKHTGFTPHEYIINTRMTAAKYLLKNTHLSIKDICFQTGFSTESVFCSAFKKRLGITPLGYRNSENA